MGIRIDKFCVILICILFIVTATIKTSIGQKDIANYEMQIVLDDDLKRIDGKTKLIWTNISEEPVDVLHLHLYYNAFKNNQSTFFSDNNGRLGFLRNEDECNWGWSEVEQFRDDQGRALAMRYIQPDDNNPNDQTVLEVQLLSPVLAGETKSFDFEWKAQIPRIMPRTGYNMDYMFMAQWFPKVGVLEPTGMRARPETGWSCHQYHSSGEYYSDFGNYEVSIDLPDHYKLGSTGELQDCIRNGDRNIWKIKAESVIDFTWTASPHFIELKDKWKTVDLSLFCYPEHKHFAERYFTAIKYAMTFMDEHVGEYPYSKLTIVDAPIHGMFTGGMEYPMLISSFGLSFFPKKIRVSEILAIHEFIHQYFMQLVATNEAEDPWMDEGMTTYYECRLVDKYYGEKESAIDFCGIKSGNWEYNRYELINGGNEHVAPAKYKSWEFPPGSYGNVAYNKMASVLNTLEKLMGQDHFDNCMKAYFEAWKYRHPGPQDFIDVFNQYAELHLKQEFPNGLSNFFEQTMFEDGSCDYEVLSFASFDLAGREGVFDIEQPCISEDASSEYAYINDIFLKRTGEISLPIELKLIYEDGSTELMIWQNEYFEEKLQTFSKTKLTSVELDPDFKIDLDINRINNGKRITQNSLNASKYGKRVQSLIQLFMESLSFLL